MSRKSAFVSTSGGWVFEGYLKGSGGGGGRVMGLEGCGWRRSEFSWRVEKDGLLRPSVQSFVNDSLAQCPKPPSCTELSIPRRIFEVALATYRP